MLTFLIRPSNRSKFYHLKTHRTPFKTKVQESKSDLKRITYQENNKNLYKGIIFQVKVMFLGCFHAINYIDPATTSVNYLDHFE